MVRHASVPINTLKPHHHHPHHHHHHHHTHAAAAAAATQTASATTTHTISLGTATATAATTGYTSFGEHRRISSFPGGRTAAAFLTNLSANLQIPDSESPFPSPISTPPSMRGSNELQTSHLAPPSPLSAAVLAADMDSTDDGAAVLSPIPYTTTTHEEESATADDPLADIPPLDTYVAETEADKVAALKLVADSVAQQRQSASWAVISNPSVVAVWVLALAVAAHFLYRDSSDWPTMLTTGTGVTMAALVAVRFFTSKYITLAEGVNWSFLDEADAVVVSRWGDTVIGACVVSLVGGQGNRGQRRRKRGVVRAWTVGLKWRGKGIGMGLLEEACKVVGGRGGDGIEFADEHANAVRVLHPFFNSPFDVRDERAREALKVAVRSTSAFGKKRRSY